MNKNDRDESHKKKNAANYRKLSGYCPQNPNPGLAPPLELNLILYAGLIFFLCCIGCVRADPCHLLLIRHGETEALANRIYHENSNLNAQGAQQALDIVDQLQEIPIAAIYSSPLPRAVQTAHPLATARDLPIIVCDDLKERCHGSAEGLPMADLEGTPSFNLYYHPKHREDLCIRLVPDAENYEESTLRFSNILKKISTNHPGQTIVVFCHFGLMQGLRIVLTGRFDHPPIPNGSCLHITGEENTLSLLHNKNISCIFHKLFSLHRNLQYQ